MDKSQEISYIGHNDSISNVRGNVVPSHDGVGIKMFGTIISGDHPIEIEMSKDEQSFQFHSNLQYWNNSTAYFSSNNYDNSYFRAIVNMGEDAVPYIKQELEKGPSSLVHALDLIYPGRVKFKGFVSLKRACDVWLGVLNR